MDFLVCFTNKDYNTKIWYIFRGASAYGDFMNDSIFELFMKSGCYTWSACQIPDNTIIDFARIKNIDYKRWKNI